MKDRLSITVVPVNKLKRNKLNDSIIWKQGWGFKFMKHVFMAIKKR